MLPAPRLEIDPCDVAATLRLERELGVSGVLAQVLVRRGLADPDAARAWLAAEDRHDLAAFAGLAEAAALVRRHIADGGRITVHGDYDVDGMASTAILVRALRELGADVGWFLPSRTEDGYGLSAATVERLAARGTRLLITVDCGITAVDEVAAARAAGMDVVVTDHHSPRADGLLPDAPLVHPAVAGYPCPELCGAGVAHVLARALRDDDAERPEDLELVALATVADCVPLRGENRRLVRAGLRAMGTTRSEGLRALMKVAKADPARIDARAIGFRLAPRLNAAGRLYRADAGVELLLTGEAERARVIAEELDRANAERRHVEQRILFEAEGMVAEAGERSAYVLAGEGWHPGVIGIVASRIAERHHRPCVLVALDGDAGTGSGRSIPAFDLLGGLQACAEHLARHGGHRAAAGCQVRRADVDAFRAAFEAHASAVLRPEDLVPTQRVDAVVAGDELGMTLAEELEALAPFGTANPDVALLVPAARLCDPRPMGEGRHVRFTVLSGGRRAQAVAFGVAQVDCDAPVDAVFAQEVNEWGGAVSPRLVLRHALPLRAGRDRGRRRAGRLRRRRARGARRRAAAARPATAGRRDGPAADRRARPRPPRGRHRRDRRRARAHRRAGAARRRRRRAARAAARLDRRWPAPVLARRAACRSGPRRRRPRRRHRPAGDARRGGRPAGGRSWPDGPSGLGTRRTRMDSATPRA